MMGWLHRIPGTALAAASSLLAPALLVAEEPRSSGETFPAVEARPPADPELARILAKAGEYVVECEERFRNLVAEDERQQWVDANGIATAQYQPGDVTSRLRSAEGMSRRPRLARRTTRAALIFVPLDPPFLWDTFRDVFEVDGEMVREPDARLERLLREAGTSATARARQIDEESEAYVLGTVVRTINVPTLPLVFLHPRNQSRFVFERKGRKRIAGVQGVEVRFEETARPTLVRLERAADLPARGRLWIDPGHGTVLRSRVEFTSSRGEATIETEYRSEPGLGLWVPFEMDERYGTSGARTRYSGFRRMGAGVDERLPPTEPAEPE